MQSMKRQHTADVTDPAIFAPAPVPGRQDIPRRRTAAPVKTIHYTTPPDHDTDAPLRITVRHQGRAPSWLLPVGIVGAVMVFGYMLVVGWILPTANHLVSQWHQGDARIGYQQLTLNGVRRDVLAMGYKGKLVVLILANLQDKNSHATEYIAPQYFPDGQSRALVVQVMDVNRDGIPDLVIEVTETTQAQSVAPVLYGQPGGGFAWTPPPVKG